MMGGHEFVQGGYKPKHPRPTMPIDAPNIDDVSLGTIWRAPDGQLWKAVQRSRDGIGNVRFWCPVTAVSRARRREIAIRVASLISGASISAVAFFAVVTTHDEWWTVPVLAATAAASICGLGAGLGLLHELDDTVILPAAETRGDDDAVR